MSCGAAASKHRHAIAVLLRVFLETSVDHFLTSAGISRTVPTGAGDKDKSLRKKSRRPWTTWSLTTLQRKISSVSQRA